MNLSKLLPQSRRTPSRSNDDDGEESVPLTSLETDYDDAYPSPSSSRSRARDPKSSYLNSINWKRWIILGGLSYLSYRFIVYLYSNPERWDKSWKDTLTGPRAVVVDPVVRAAGQKWRGEVDEREEFIGFKGVRYAEPPVGERRFRRAVPVTVQTRSEEEWEKLEPIEAREWSEGCPRPENNIAGSEGHSGVEDCLKLNIFTPRKRIPDKLFPVMFWIHGGGFVSGSSNEEKYDPTDLMSRAISMNQPFVFVSINYRLGALGFSAAPPPPGEPPIAPHIPVRAPVDLDLNVGLKDQLEALKWVRREIGNWGVTLVGHSAGAISVGLHQIYSPPELFRAAFMLSGAPTSFPVPWPHDAGARTLHPLPGPSHCPSPVQQPYGPPSNALLLSCLRSLPLADFMRATKTLSDRSPVNGWFPWYPVLEGEWEGSWLDFRPSERIVRGTFARVPVVLGGTVDEGTRFTSPEQSSQEMIKDAIRSAFDFTFGAIEELLTPIWEFYPSSPSTGSPYHTGNETFGLSPSYKRQASLLGDIFFQAPRRHFLRETPKDFGEPSWNYLYEERREGSEERMGVQHSADLQSWFGHPNSSDTEMHHLSRHMSSYLM
ncbi:Alpha/Beta hydrolase protein [Leucosporidium creatinivorum]|uniref:Alpha/Beta hydrolase protein n=1 Tax=Leucosporidium creatinivorum TaxID=106004 RepID=A0A1Y2E9J6_9BASI|nr:Alpha/Beta hydrolase protein [Leucosporidium creatinivorum]